MQVPPSDLLCTDDPEGAEEEEEEEEGGPLRDFQYRDAFVNIFPSVIGRASE